MIGHCFPLDLAVEEIEGKKNNELGCKHREHCKYCEHCKHYEHCKHCKYCEHCKHHERCKYFEHCEHREHYKYCHKTFIVNIADTNENSRAMMKEHKYKQL